MPGRSERATGRRLKEETAATGVQNDARNRRYFLNRSSNAFRASFGLPDINPLEEDGAGEAVTAVGAVSFSTVVRKA